MNPKEAQIRAKIKAELEAKGIQMDIPYTPVRLAKFNVIRGAHGQIADHQHIRRLARLGKIKSVTTDENPNYIARLIYGEDVLEYLISQRGSKIE